MNLYAALRDRVADHLGSPFLVTDDRTETYGDLDSLSARLATVLVAHGVTAGERLLVQVPKSVEAVALYFAALRVGAIYVPLNEAYTAEELAYFVSDAAPVLVVGAAELARLVEEAAGAEPFELLVDKSDEPIAMLYTSGTTGKPKGAMLTAPNLLSNARTLTDLWGFTHDDVLVHALPIFHVHGLFVALHCAMVSGCQVRFLPRFDAAAVRTALAGATVLMGVPTFYTRLLALHDFGPADCRTMRLFVSSSAPLTAATHEAFAARTGHRILERYGMTETGMITSNPLDGERIAGTVGFPLPEVEVRISAPDPSGVGVVEVRGPNVFAGYWGMPEKTAAAFTADGWFVTGDMGALDASGRLTLSGRGTDLIISGGLNVYPKEIELVLDEIDGVDESAVIGVPHPDLGDGIVAVLVASPGFDTATVAAALDGRLARFKHPKHVAVVDALPRNAMGKVEKAALRRRYADTFTA